MEKKIYIVGAHSRAQTLSAYLRYLYPELTVEAFLYDNEEENPPVLGNTPVICCNETVSLHTEYPVYIGTKGASQQRITEHLKQLGFTRIFPVTVKLDLRLRNAYLEKYFAETGRDYRKIDRLELPEKRPEVSMSAKADVGIGLEEKKAAEKSARIYVATSIYDKPLKQDYRIAPYEKKIITGAALSDETFSCSAVTDNKGDNISERNRQFCELTALYWIWKHAKEDIVGLVHYRRHFILPKDWPMRMQENGIDVILPLPLYVAPDIAGNYKSRHDLSDWDYMMEYLKENNIREYQEAERFFRTNLYSPCNMFIMGRNVLEALCQWLFPILFAAAEHGGEKQDRYQNRYPGFLSERLITFFFELHRNEYNVVYADKNFLT